MFRSGSDVFLQLKRHLLYLPKLYFDASMVVNNWTIPGGQKQKEVVFWCTFSSFHKTKQKGIGKDRATSQILHISFKTF